MTKLFLTFQDGLIIGSLYALVALGYTMVYGVLRFINFAHGDVVMIGAWVAFLAVGWLKWLGLGGAPPFVAGMLALATAMTLCALLGLTIERLAYRPLRNAPRLNVLIAAIGVSLLLENAGQLPFVFGTQPQTMPPLLPDLTLNESLNRVLGTIHAQVHIGLLNHIRLLDAVIVATTLALMVVLDRLVFATRLGLAMRAVAFDHQLASLMGVPVNRVVSITFAIGSALAAAGGFLFASKYRSLQQPVDPSWILLGLKAFVAAVVGGIGKLRGAMLGGLLIGLLEMFGAGYLSSNLRDVYVFALLILVLLVRPTGILGRSALEKV